LLVCTLPRQRQGLLQKPRLDRAKLVCSILRVPSGATAWHAFFFSILSGSNPWCARSRAAHAGRSFRLPCAGIPAARNPEETWRKCAGVESKRLAGVSGPRANELLEAAEHRAPPSGVGGRRTGSKRAYQAAVSALGLARTANRSDCCS